MSQATAPRTVEDRRAPGMGTLTERSTKDGTPRWEAQVVLPRTAEGKRRIKSKWFPRAVDAKGNNKTHDPGKDQATVWLNAMRAEVAAGLHDAGVIPAAPQTPAATLTVGEWMQEWLMTRRSLVKSSTHRSYSDLWRLHLAPHLADVELATLTPRRLTSAYAAIREAGTGASTCHAAHRTIRAALTSARKAGLITTNPAQDAELAKRPKYVAKTWTVEQARTFMTYAVSSGDRNAALWAFMLSTGVRRGEALGLQWSDLDLSSGSATTHIHRNLSEVGGDVTRSTSKSDAGHREIPLHDHTVKILATWRDRLTVERATAQSWHDHPEVFVNEVGHHHTPDRISKMFQAACAAAGVPVIRLHDVRHTTATLWLRQGVGLKTVSTLLGHSSVSVTGDIYAHVMPETARAASDVMASLLA